MMKNQQAETLLSAALSGPARRNALALAACLQASGVELERGGGYWADKLYWLAKYRGEYVCFILVNGRENEAAPWIVWTDDSGADCFADSAADARVKETAWANVDFCGACGGCGKPGGSRRTIFGREFERVCRTAMRFTAPDAQALECIEKLVELRLRDILKAATP